MSDFGNYLLAQQEKKTAEADYSYAGVKLELTIIKARWAELISQSEPMESFICMNISEREKLLLIAKYVVVGRPRPDKEQV